MIYTKSILFVIAYFYVSMMCHQTTQLNVFIVFLAFVLSNPTKVACMLTAMWCGSVCLVTFAVPFPDCHLG